MNIRLKLAVCAVLAAGVLAAFGCRSTAPPATQPPATPGRTSTSMEPTVSDPTSSTPPTVTANLTPTYRYGQAVGQQIPVYATTEPAPVLMTLPAADPLGSPTILAVLDERTGWLQVRLPARPNGAVGWVKAEDVAVGSTDVDVLIDTATHHLTVRKAGVPVLESAVGLGAAATPTPTGSFYVTDLVDVGSDTGPYGRYAFGLSGHSDVLTEFGGGDGQIAVHGTNDPPSIGGNVSHGCIRVPTDVDAQLASLLTYGAPVTVT